jgi:hypothetical protein
MKFNVASNQAVVWNYAQMVIPSTIVPVKFSLLLLENVCDNVSVLMIYC